jgi:hypothetical protein
MRGTGLCSTSYRPSASFRDSNSPIASLHPPTESRFIRSIGLFRKPPLVFVFWKTPASLSSRLRSPSKCKSKATKNISRRWRGEGLGNLPTRLWLCLFGLRGPVVRYLRSCVQIVYHPTESLKLDSFEYKNMFLSPLISRTWDTNNASFCYNHIR